MAYTKPKKYNKVRFTHHFWRDIASGASYASYTSKTLTIGFGITPCLILLLSALFWSKVICINLATYIHFFIHPRKIYHISFSFVTLNTSSSVVFPANTFLSPSARIDGVLLRAYASNSNSAVWL